MHDFVFQFHLISLQKLGIAVLHCWFSQHEVKGDKYLDFYPLLFHIFKAKSEYKDCMFTSKLFERRKPFWLSNLNSD